MQRIYAIVIFIITATFAQAQINEVPLSSNPILEKLHAAKQQRINNMLQKRMASMNMSAVTRDPFVALAECLQEEAILELCSDTIGLGINTTINILNSAELNFGMATIDGICVFYEANSNVGFGTDSIAIEVCPSNPNSVCDTTIYPIFVHRPDETITLAPNIINAEDTITVCVDATVLPGDFISATVIGNNTQLGNAFPFGDCIFYEATKFGGTDVVSFEICDDLCNCDTYEIPFVISQDTIDIPFMDDFSYEGPLVNDNWVTDDVFVNNTMAIDPVSVGVATFDGLNRRGAPHGGGYGPSDDLTSAYLDLDGFSGGSNVYLSFYIQPQGLGEAPAGADSLILEFKNSSNEWILIDTFKNESMERDSIFDMSTPPVFLETVPAFHFFSYHISQPQYLFKGFQFRFRNFSSRSGNIDHWHLDYVRLNNNVDGSEFLDDIAFTEIPNPILETYTSMPWWHFIDNVDDEIPTEDLFIETHIYNHSEFPNTAENSTIDIVELQTGTNVLTNLGLLQGNEADIFPGFALFDFPTIASSVYPTFKTSINNDFSNTATLLEFEKTYSFNVGEENPNVNPIVEDNNVVTHTTVFDNYFAYDDGTAEGGFEATKNNVQIAMEFHSNVDDTLKAVQIHFPHIKVNTDNQLFNLRVWIGELDNTPEYDGILQKPLYIDSYRDSLNGFTTYILEDIISGDRTPLFIPAGKFYVGWQQVSVCDLNECIAVGNDKNNPDGMQFVSFDAFGDGSVWKEVLTVNPTLKGSLMIRPVVGEGQPEASASTEDLTNQTRFSIYPNPTQGWLKVNIENGNFNQFNYTIFDAVGKSLGTNNLTDQLDMGNLENGIYFLKIVNNKTNEVFNHKIILVK